MGWFSWLGFGKEAVVIEAEKNIDTHIKSADWLKDAAKHIKKKKKRDEEERKKRKKDEDEEGDGSVGDISDGVVDLIDNVAAALSSSEGVSEEKLEEKSDPTTESGYEPPAAVPDSSPSSDYSPPSSDYSSPSSDSGSSYDSGSSSDFSSGCDSGGGGCDSGGGGGDF